MAWNGADSAAGKRGRAGEAARSKTRWARRIKGGGPLDERPSHRLGIAVSAILFVAAVVGGVWWWNSLERGQTAAPGETPSVGRVSLLRAANPSARGTEPPSTVDESPAHGAKIRKRSNDGAKTYRDERGILRYEGGARVFDPDAPRRAPIRVAGKPLFRHYAENQISALLVTPPGDPVFVTRRYDRRFAESFKRSLSDPTEFLETDTPDERELKRTMSEVKKELSDRIARGEDVCKIMEETYSELTRLASYKRDVMRMVREAQKAEGLTDRDCADIVSAANRMLEANGIAPIRNVGLVGKNLKLNYGKVKKGE